MAPVVKWASADPQFPPYCLYAICQTCVIYQYYTMLGGANTTTYGDCAGVQPVEGAAANAALALAHAATLAALVATARFIRRGVEVAHPVFAVVLQEVSVLCAADAAVLAVVVTLAVCGRDAGVLIMVMSVTSVAALQFHQLSWLCVTVLR